MPSEPVNFANLKRTTPSRRERLLRLIWNCCPRGPAFDALLSRKLPELRHLPERNPDECIPDFNSTRVTIQQCPVGGWSTPLIDTVVLVKCALGFKSRRILEIGSYLGYTAKMLAENTSAETRITTLDEYPEHGAAYRGTPLEQKIDRRIGKISLEHFRAGEKYDLIFVDADHRFESVMNDTQVALGLLAENGVVVWHDYQNLHHFQGYNDVPEGLKLFSAHLPIVAIKGTWLAIYSRHAGWETSKLLKAKATQASGDPWKDRTLRG
jgi:Predicted O-methyltransferase